MPKYQVTVPGQGTFEIESPTELTEEQVLAQLKYIQPATKSAPTVSAPVKSTSPLGLVGQGVGLLARSGWRGLQEGSKYVTEGLSDLNPIGRGTEDLNNMLLRNLRGVGKVAGAVPRTLITAMTTGMRENEVLSPEGMDRYENYLELATGLYPAAKVAQSLGRATGRLPKAEPDFLPDVNMARVKKMAEKHGNEWVQPDLSTTEVGTDAVEQALRRPSIKYAADDLARGGENLTETMEQQAKTDLLWQPSTAQAEGGIIRGTDAVENQLKTSAENVAEVIAEKRFKAEQEALARGGQVVERTLEGNPGQITKGTDAILDSSADARMKMETDDLVKGSERLETELSKPEALRSRGWEDYTAYSGVDPTLLPKALQNPAARGVFGAGLGALYGDTDEERTGGALVGGLVGLFGRRMIPSKERIAAFKATAKLPGVGFTPADVARGFPDAEKLVQFAQRRETLGDIIESHWVERVRPLYKQLTPDEIRQVNQALDTPGGGMTAASLNPAQQAAYTEMRAVLDEVADSLGIEHTDRISDYFPRIRERMAGQHTDIIKVGDREIPTYVQDILPNKMVKRWFERERTAPEVPADDLGLDPIAAYLRGASRKVAYEGGTDPRTQQAITNMIDTIRPEIDALPESLKPYFIRHLNDVLGINRGVQGALKETSPLFAVMGRGVTPRDMRNLQFIRTLGANPAGAVVNLTQNLLTFAEADTLSFLGGLKDAMKAVRDPVARQALRARGIRADFSKADHDLIEMGERTLLDKTSDHAATSGMFKGAEWTNRAVAWFTGLRMAAKQGLTGQDAEDFAMDLVKKTQFNTGKANAPEALRDPLSNNKLYAALDTSMRQYKSFPINYALAIKNMASDDIRNITEGVKAIGSGEFKEAANKIISASKTAKFGIGGSVVFGSDAMSMGLDKELSEALTGDRETLTIKGFVPLLGIHIGQQIGLGVMPVEDFRSLMFFLPGPAASMVADAASAVIGKDFSSESVARGTIGENLSSGERAAKAARVLPFGVQLDRVRKALLHGLSEAPESVRVPVNAKQAFGLSPMNEGNPAIRESEEVFGWGERASETGKQFFGFSGPKTVETRRALRGIGELEKSAKETVARLAQELVSTGDIDSVVEQLDQFNKTNKTNETITVDNILEAVKKGILVPSERRLRRSKKSLRPQIMEKLEEVEEEDE